MVSGLHLHAFPVPSRYPKALYKNLSFTHLHTHSHTNVYQGFFPLETEAIIVIPLVMLVITGIRLSYYLFLIIRITMIPLICSSLNVFTTCMKI